VRVDWAANRLRDRSEVEYASPYNRWLDGKPVKITAVKSTGPNLHADRGGTVTLYLGRHDFTVGHSTRRSRRVYDRQRT